MLAETRKIFSQKPEYGESALSKALDDFRHNPITITIARDT